MAVCRDERTEERALVKGNRALDAGVESNSTLSRSEMGPSSSMFQRAVSGEGVGDGLVE